MQCLEGRVRANGAAFSYSPLPLTPYLQALSIIITISIAYFIYTLIMYLHKKCLYILGIL
jgi:hypothetical protein